MRLIVDSNKMQSEDLKMFLEHRLSNFAVLTDFVAMEAYRGDTLNSIYKSLEVVSKFPRQVIVLKNSIFAARQSGRRKCLQKRLIDQTQTVGFPLFIENLIQAKQGNSEYVAKILENGRMAEEHFSQMVKEAEIMKPAMDDLGRHYSKEERNMFRKKCNYTPEMAKKIINSTLEISELIFLDSINVRKLPPRHELPNTFFFRYSLACYLMVLTRSSEGGILSTSPNKLRNDFVDMGIVAYATFFDGVLSADARLMDVFVEACAILKHIFGAEVPYLKHIDQKVVFGTETT